MFIYTSLTISYFYLDKIPILVLDKNFGGQISPLRFESTQVVPHHSKKGEILIPPYRIYTSFLVVRIYTNSV